MKEEEFKYPMWFRRYGETLVVKFNSLTSGVVENTGMSWKKGFCGSSWVAHTNEEVWEDVTHIYKDTIESEKTSIPPLELCGTPKSAMDVQVGGNHYKKMKIQPMEYSMANNLDAMQHTIIKYVSRFRDKNGIEDLKKAKHTIDMLIEWEQNNVEA